MKAIVFFLFMALFFFSAFEAPRGEAADDIPNAFTHVLDKADAWLKAHEQRR